MRQKKESQWSNRDLLEVKCVVDEQVGEFHCRLCGELITQNFKQPIYIFDCKYCNYSEMLLSFFEKNYCFILRGSLRIASISRSYFKTENYGI